jgi:hypothetical protein
VRRRLALRAPLSFRWRVGRAQATTSAFLRTLRRHAMLDYLACRGDEATKSPYPLPPDDAFRDKFPEMAHWIKMSLISPGVSYIKLTTLEKLHELLHLHPDVQCSLRMRLPQHTSTLLDIAPLGYQSYYFQLLTVPHFSLICQ